jgi:DNA invertase Pin-like site-specific DNA recombinase
MTLASDPTTAKVTRAHLERRAYVYVRQSSPKQVDHNLQSKQRQYDFAQVALQLGWAPGQIVVVDQDQGQSGSRAHARTGFGRLVTAVGLGEVGMVMSLEASRLARNSPDWHNLIYMSRYTDTLIADEHGIYDPTSPTDRMVLGLRGQMSELELETSIHRMTAGRLHKAQRGELVVHPPAGYDLDDLCQVAMTSDEAVAHAIRTVFDKFDVTVHGGGCATRA